LHSIPATASVLPSVSAMSIRFSRRIASVDECKVHLPHVQKNATMVVVPIDSLALPDEMAAEPGPITGREPGFLLECMRSFLRPGHPVSLPSGLDWLNLFAMANKHSVIPLLYASLHQVGFENIPPNHLAEFQKMFREGLYRNLALRSELKKISRLLARQNIDVRVLKGPVLGGLLYRDPAIGRTFEGSESLLRSRTLRDISPGRTAPCQW
jgi:hypothetical protein